MRGIRSTPIPKTCEMCEAVFPSLRSDRHFCDSCRKIRQLVHQRQYAERTLNRPVLSKSAFRPCSICSCEKPDTKRYCESCRSARRKEVSARYLASDKGKSTKSRWLKSPKYLQSIADYLYDEPRRARNIARSRLPNVRLQVAVYQASIPGQLTIARARARRQGIGDAQLFATRYLRMCRNKEICGVCSRDFQKGAFDLDHIIPVAVIRYVHSINALRGITHSCDPHEWWNLQPLCKPCHTLKTSRDSTYIAGWRRIFRQISKEDSFAEESSRSDA